jgi:iron-sulfur cluster repair protein YtfE (RIC family)
MQCGLQFQAEAVTVSHEGAQEEHLVRLRLPTDSSPAQRALAEELYERVEGGGTPMHPLTQPLRDEHLELLLHLERIRTVADAIGMAKSESVREGVEEVYTFLMHQLTPHAQAEERVLYPTIGRLLGTPTATTTMSQDHREIERLTQALGTLRSQLAGESLDEPEVQAQRRILYGLYALVSVHFAKEEDIYLPLLDTRLTKQEAQKMFEEMDLAVQEAKRTVAR